MLPVALESFISRLWNFFTFFLAEHLNTFFGGAQKVKYQFRQSKAHYYKRLQASQCFLNAYFRWLILYWGHFFWQLCHVGICCLKYVVLLSCEQLDLPLLILFFAALLQWFVGSSEHFIPSLKPFYLKSFLVFQMLPWHQLLHLSSIF